MRSLSFLLFAVLIIFICECKPRIQQKDLPAGISEAFTVRYPEDQKIEWSRTDSGKFEVNFSLKNENFSAFYSSNASWILTEKRIKVAALPVTVISTINNGFGDYSIQSIEQVQSASLGNYYSIQLKNGKEKLHLNLSHDGVILNYSDLKRDKN
jgi:hypothetical protein